MRRRYSLRLGIAICAIVFVWALVLALAAPAFAAGDGSGNQKQTSAAPGVARGAAAASVPPYNVVICAARDGKGKAFQKRIDVPQGKKDTDVCPQADIVERRLSIPPGSKMQLPVVAHLPAPKYGRSP